MERTLYLKMAQYASAKTKQSGSWWAVTWEDSDLVIFKGTKYVPWKYVMGFDINGKATHQCLIHDLHSNTEYNVLLSEVEPVKEVT